MSDTIYPVPAEMADNAHINADTYRRDYQLSTKSSEANEDF